MKVSLKVVPGSSRDEIVGWFGESLKVKVRAPAEKGRANAAVIEVIASSLGIPQKSIEIISGTTSARKVIEVSGLSGLEIRARLEGNYA